VPDFFLQNQVVEILRFGLTGLCFLFSLLAFYLLQREQKIERPRKSILKNIRFFTTLNFISALLVATFSLIAKPQIEGPHKTKIIDAPHSDYLINETQYILDFSNWIPIPEEGSGTIESPVKMTRIDEIIKLNDHNVDFIIPQYTTGKRIDGHFIQFPSPIIPEYKPIKKAPGESGKAGYQYALAIGKEGRGFETTIKNIFTFVNGFKNTPTEWFAASVRYPTKRIIVEMRFPDGKPAKKVNLYLREGIAERKNIKNPKIEILSRGQIVKWEGKDFPANSRVFFEFDW
jgi:hypothetical protein